MRPLDGIIADPLFFKKIESNPLIQRESCAGYYKAIRPPSMSKVYGQIGTVRSYGRSSASRDVRRVPGTK